jgi:hypothetical protein
LALNKNFENRKEIKPVSARETLISFYNPPCFTNDRGLSTNAIF